MSRKLVLLLVTNRRCPNKVTNIAKLGVGDKGSSFLVAQGTSPPGQSAVRHTSLLLLLWLPPFTFISQRVAPIRGTRMREGMDAFIQNYYNVWKIISVHAPQAEAAIWSDVYILNHPSYSGIFLLYGFPPTSYRNASKKTIPVCLFPVNSSLLWTLGSDDFVGKKSAVRPCKKYSCYLGLDYWPDGPYLEN